MMLVIDTQYMENYGDATNPYWKFKGGSSYKVVGIPSGVDFSEVVEMVSSEIEYRNDYTEQYIIGYGSKDDDWLSDFEKSQLEYEGFIQYKEPTIDYSELNARYA
jgi:hypothetical protein